MNYKGTDLNICVVSGLAKARQIMEQVRSGEKKFHFIEVMACPGGCIMGGGQPIKIGRPHVQNRQEGIYRSDKMASVKKCGDNPMVLSLYDGFLKGKEHLLLHNSKFCAKNFR